MASARRAAFEQARDGPQQVSQFRRTLTEYSIGLFGQLVSKTELVYATRQDDDRHLGVSRANLRDHLSSIHLRHLVVGDDDVKVAAVEGPQASGPGRHRGHQVALLLKHVSAHDRTVAVVVDQEYVWLFAIHLVRLRRGIFLLRREEYQPKICSVNVAQNDCI